MAAWLFFQAAHLLGLVTMALLVIPGFDTSRAVAERASYIAQHPWLWRLGWLPWQLCAVADLVVSTCLWRWARSHGGRGAVAGMTGLLLTCLAVVPDQLGEAMLVTRHVDLARAAVASGDHAAFVASEAWTLLLTGSYGNDLYVLMTIAWMACIARAAFAAPVRGFLAVGATSLAAFAASGAAITLAVQDAPAYSGAGLGSVAAGLGFVLLAVWGVLAAERLARAHRQRHPRPDADAAHLVWPHAALAGLWGGLGNSGGIRDMLRTLPVLRMRSEVCDVVYLNWMVPVERVAAWVPSPLALDVREGLTALSILTYVHGHFGPRVLGPLRWLMPSPAQSNWRLYLQPPAPGAERDAVLFFANAIDSGLYAVASRLLADGLPLHLAGAMRHRRQEDQLATEIEPRGGSAPDLVARVRETNAPPLLPAAFAARFGSWEETVRYLTRQQRAVSSRPDLGGVLASNIHIPIALADVRPAVVLGEVDSTLLAETIAGCEALAFVVPRVAFAALGEELIAPA